MSVYSGFFFDTVSSLFGAAIAISFIRDMLLVILFIWILDILKKIINNN